jgi:uncharacterized protein
MRIGVVSDTHMPMRAKSLPQALVNGLQGVDYILHGGDWVSLHVAEELAKIAPVDGVAGNNDGDEIIARFGRQKVLTFQGFRIGIVHGDGYRKTTEERAYETFTDANVDIIIFGHSHIPYVEKRGQILLFNPGSPTDKRRQKEFSYGILELGEEITVSHYYYSDK